MVPSSGRLVLQSPYFELVIKGGMESWKSQFFRFNLGFSPVFAWHLCAVTWCNKWNDHGIQGEVHALLKTMQCNSWWHILILVLPFPQYSLSILTVLATRGLESALILEILVTDMAYFFMGLLEIACWSWMIIRHLKSYAQQSHTQLLQWCISSSQSRDHAFMQCSTLRGWFCTRCNPDCFSCSLSVCFQHWLFTSKRI